MAHIVDSTLYGFDDDDELPDIEGDPASDGIDINTITPSISGISNSVIIEEKALFDTQNVPKGRISKIT